MPRPKIFKNRAEYLRFWRANNLEKARKLGRDWAKKNRLENPVETRKKDTLIRLKTLEARKIYQRTHPPKRDPLKYAARSILNNAVRLGKVVRPSKCEKCETSKVQAHHSDYSKPLEVMWLCSKCHALEHHPIKCLEDINEILK